MGFSCVTSSSSADLSTVVLTKAYFHLPRKRKVGALWTDFAVENSFEELKIRNYPVSGYLKTHFFLWRILGFFSSALPISPESPPVSFGPCLYT